MNKIILIGRLTREVELTKLQSGISVAKLTLAVERPFKRDTTDFINCVSFGKTADYLEQYAGKGKRITVTGYLQTGSYTNKEGQKVYTTDVNVQEVEIIDWKNKEESSKKEDKQDVKKEEPFSFGDDFEFGTSDDKIPF